MDEDLAEWRLAYRRMQHEMEGMGDSDDDMRENHAAAARLERLHENPPPRPNALPPAATQSAAATLTDTAIEARAAECCRATCSLLGGALLGVLKIVAAATLGMFNGALYAVMEETAPLWQAAEEKLQDLWPQIRRNICAGVAIFLQTMWAGCSRGAAGLANRSSLYLQEHFPWLHRAAADVATRAERFARETVPQALARCHGQILAWQEQHGTDNVRIIANVFAFAALVLCSNLTSALWWLGLLCCIPHALLSTMPAPAAEQEQPNIPELRPCPVCYVNQPNTAAVPCGHLLCEACMARVQRSNAAFMARCPTCNQRITGTMRVYLP